MHAEYIKYAPVIIIADILTKSVETDDYLEILKEGIATPLKKHPKKENERRKRTISDWSSCCQLLERFLQYA